MSRPHFSLCRPSADDAPLHCGRRKRAAAGDVEAMVVLAEYFWHGDNPHLGQDHREAVKLYTAAAAKGSEQAKWPQ